MRWKNNNGLDLEVGCLDMKSYRVTEEHKPFSNGHC